MSADPCKGRGKTHGGYDPEFSGGFVETREEDVSRVDMDE
jgi:hypothetical protein